MADPPEPTTSMSTPHLHSTDGVAPPLYHSNKKIRLEPQKKNDQPEELNMVADYKTELSLKFKERIEEKKEKIPAHVLQTIEEELTNFQVLEVTSSIYKATIRYLDWMTALPWGNYSDAKFDVIRARKVLDEDHYGCSSVKQRILEFISGWKNKGTSQGKIICLCGPPGVGKTSIVCSIARALDRKLFRFSAGGLSDVFEIKGHHKYYNGAMPGKMVQCLKNVGTANPLVLIDEIDKLRVGHASALAYALWEHLDPQQSASFLDYYLGVPIDLSKVLFMCTANVSENIPDLLLDRMEVIPISGYVTEEKMDIARDYLEKQISEEYGVKPEQVNLTDDALVYLIENYCREDGVRDLQKQIEKIYRKVEFLLGVKATETIVVDNLNLVDYVGEPVFHADRIYDRTPVGVVMDFAWTATGVTILYVETTEKGKIDGKGNLLMAELGHLMKETAQVANTVARAILKEKEPDNHFFANFKLHLRVFSEVTPEDGVSAGCSMITSFLSLAMKKPVKKDLAITGEVTLNRKILPIDGIQEKIFAARRSKLKTIILPSGNMRDFSELSPKAKEGLDVHFVDNYNQIFDLAFD